MTKKNTIVIFLGGYLPGSKYGGPVTSIENFVNQMHKYYNMKIICSDHDFKDTTRYENISNGWNSVGNAEVFYTNEKKYTSKAFYEIVKPFAKNIELFYLSGIYYIQMNYAVMKMARKLGIPVLLAPRGDLMKDTISMKNRTKKIKKIIFLFLCRVSNLFEGIFFQSTSGEETYGLHHYLHISDKYIFQLPNMPVTKRQHPRQQKRENHLNVIFVSRMTVKKNPLKALKIIEKMDDSFDVKFDLYGPKEDEVYWKQCNKMINKINVTKKNIRAEYKGALPPHAAKKIYDNYDCFLFPTASENYGHVIVESLFAGCPVILSKGTTPFDDCHNSGSFVADLNYLSEFTNYLEIIAGMNQEEYQELLQLNDDYIEKKFQIEKLRNEYLQMIKAINDTSK